MSHVRIPEAVGASLRVDMAASHHPLVFDPIPEDRIVESEELAAIIQGHRDVPIDQAWSGYQLLAD